MRQSWREQQTAAWRKTMQGAPTAQGEHILGETISLEDAPPAPMPAMAERPAASSGRIGQYEIIRALGRGGMGEVHLARDLRLGRLVAIKLLTGHRARLTERFLAEARTTASCNHENIVVIHEVGKHEGTPFMVLEYLEGQTLRQWLQGQSPPAMGRDDSMSARGHAPVPPGRAVELMLPVVRALAYAHERGIVHRDLKPENVMLTEAGTIKVLDFGIAKLLSAPEHIENATMMRELLPSAVSSSALIGTLPYMSPEQMNMGVIDHRSDLWAVGIMLFEMVTGRHPVPSLSPRDLLDVADDELPMPSVRERMPDLGPLGAVIDRCLLKNPEHRTASARELLAELEALAPGHRIVRLRGDGNPFAGLAAFQEADADRFFGRTRDIDQVVAQLRSRPLVAVVGPSGVGKSSLIRAGVIPALKRSGEGWDACVVRPGRQPLAALAAALAQVSTARGTAHEPRGAAASPALDGAPNHTIDLEGLRIEPGYLGVQLRARAASKLRRILVFVDQFEELYTLGTPASERTAFLACLTAMADDAASPLRVVLSMRSDFLDRLTEDRQFGAEVTRGLVLLPPMGREGLREALTHPVEATELRFESPVLVDRMVDALETTVGALPLLQFTAARLWELRDLDRRLLTEASYEQIAGVAGALASHADAVLAGMPSPRQALARTVFERLVTPERTRALVSAAELRALHRDSDAVDDLIQHLAAMRLVLIESGAEGADHNVELVHESLIDRWPTLARWLDENHEDAVFLQQLRAAAAQWEARGQSADLLWRGETLEEARSWRRRYHGMLPSLHEQFLRAGFALAARRARVKRMAVAGTIAFLSLLVVAAAVALVMIRRAQEVASEQAQVARAAGARAEANAAEARSAEEQIRAQLDVIRKAEAERAAALDQAQTLLERFRKSEAELFEGNRKLQAALRGTKRARDRARRATARAQATSEQLARALAEAKAAHEKAERLLRQERDRLARRLNELGPVNRTDRPLR